MENINVTTHARTRWLERAALFGDDGKRDIADAVRESVLVQDPVQIPFRTMPDTSYYFHALTGAWFIVVPLDEKSGTVVSVIMPGYVPPVPTPKKRVKKPKPPEMEGPTPGFADLGEERDWLIVETTRVSALLAAGNSNEKEHGKLKQQAGELHGRLARIKKPWKKWKQDQYAKYDRQAIRADGTINWALSLRELMERVEALEREVGEMRVKTNLQGERQAC